MRALHEVHGQCLLVSSCLPLSFLKSLHTIKGVVWPQVCCCFMATGWQPVLLPSQLLPAWSKAEWMEGEDYSFPGGDCFLQIPAPSLVLAKKHLCVHPGLWQCEARWPRPVPSFGAAVVAAWAKSGSMAGQETACGSANSGQVVQFSFCQWANYKLQKPWMAPGQRQDLNPSPVGGECCRWTRLPAM